MLESHNDSAVVIAEAVGGSVEEFAAMMNRKAEEIGCRDTCFLTPNGLDASDNGAVHSTTARDLALILRYCITESPCREDFLAITRTKDRSIADLDGTRSFFLVNHNVFLTMMEGALTGKTGFTQTQATVTWEPLKTADGLLSWPCWPAGGQTTGTTSGRIRRS